MSVLDGPLLTKASHIRKLAVTMAAMLRSGAPYNGIVEENENGQSNA